MPREPRKRTRPQTDTADGERIEPLALPGAQSRRRRNTTSAPRTQPGQLVDFEVAARRAADRTERVRHLKDEVQTGSYRADPLETARAMERRSDA